MIVAIVGSRDFPKLTRVDDRVRQLRDACMQPSAYGLDLTVVSGGARGVDSRVRIACRDYFGVPFEEFPADWHPFGDSDYDPSAGYKRNKRLVEMADMVIAFWDGESKGTKHTIDLALKMRKTLEVHFP